MEKLIRDGLVAVLYSPGYGAGWYTWNYDYPEILFDPVIVGYLEADKHDEINTYVALRYPDIYTGGIEDLQIRYLPVGTRFRINEYDGNETLEVQEEMNWIVA